MFNVAKENDAYVLTYNGNKYINNFDMDTAYMNVDEFNHLALSHFVDICFDRQPKHYLYTSYMKEDIEELIEAINIIKKKKRFVSYYD